MERVNSKAEQFLLEFADIIKTCFIADYRSREMTCCLTLGIGSGKEKEELKALAKKYGFNSEYFTCELVHESRLALDSAYLDMFDIKTESFYYKGVRDKEEILRRSASNFLIGLQFFYNQLGHVSPEIFWKATDIIFQELLKLKADLYGFIDEEKK